MRSGRYGPYVQHGSLRASLPSGVDAETLDVDRAVAILEEKNAKNPSAKKTPAKKAPAKKTPAKKPAPKKPSAKKPAAKKSGAGG